MSLHPPLLQARDLGFAYGSAAVLQAIDLDLTAGTCCVIRGANGAGKSTLLQLLQGRLRPGRGWIQLDGRPLQGQRRRVALVPQAAPVNWWYPIDLNGLVALAASGDSRAARQALGQVGLEALGSRQIRALSEGQRQRALLARALAQKAALLLLDEPLACLDDVSRRQFGFLLRQLVGTGVAVLLTAHGALPASLRTDRLLELRHGRLWAQAISAPWS